MKDRTPMQQVLIVDDEAVVRRGISRALARVGMTTQTASRGGEALEMLESERFNLVLLDIRMPDMDGVSVLRRIRQRYPDTKVIMLTGYPAVDSAVRCMKLGASDYLVKPFRLADLQRALDNTTAQPSLHQDSSAYPDGLKVGIDGDTLIGTGDAMRAMFQRILDLAPTDRAVFIAGERGTGKTLAARAVHAYSPRKEEPFQKLHCALLDDRLCEHELFGQEDDHSPAKGAIKYGLLELAGRGSLFLEDIETLGVTTHAKLARIMDSGSYTRFGGRRARSIDVRFIVASSHTPGRLDESGRIAGELLSRIESATLYIPPLRDRKDDIPALASYLLEKACTRADMVPPEFTPEAMRLLTHYSWPGNARELQDVLERVMRFRNNGAIHAGDVSACISPELGAFNLLMNGPVTLKELEKRYIRFALQKAKGKKTLAAQALGINRKTLTTKIRKYGLY